MSRSWESNRGPSVLLPAELRLTARPNRLSHWVWEKPQLLVLVQSALSDEITSINVHEPAHALRCQCWTVPRRSLSGTL